MLLERSFQKGAPVTVQELNQQLIEEVMVAQYLLIYCSPY